MVKPMDSDRAKHGVQILSMLLVSNTTLLPVHLTMMEKGVRLEADESHGGARGTILNAWTMSANPRKDRETVNRAIMVLARS